MFIVREKNLFFRSKMKFDFDLNKKHPNEI